MYNWITILYNTKCYQDTSSVQCPFRESPKLPASKFALFHKELASHGRSHRFGEAASGSDLGWPWSPKSVWKSLQHLDTLSCLAVHPDRKIPRLQLNAAPLLLPGRHYQSWHPKVPHHDARTGTEDAKSRPASEHMIPMPEACIALSRKVMSVSICRWRATSLQAG